MNENFAQVLYFLFLNTHTVNKFDKKYTISKNKLKFSLDILETAISSTSSGRIVALFLFYCWLGTGNF